MIILVHPFYTNRGVMNILLKVMHLISWETKLVRSWLAEKR
jgi:hypothetical protein